ncbi:MAG TPA: hypothetical protein VFT94_00590 [Gaiellaceae bacterium]|nr:hypothetical protein [Gaiellaceae bacterium]
MRKRERLRALEDVVVGLDHTDSAILRELRNVDESFDRRLKELESSGALATGAALLARVNRLEGLISRVESGLDLRIAALGSRLDTVEREITENVQAHPWTILGRIEATVARVARLESRVIVAEDADTKRWDHLGESIEAIERELQMVADERSPDRYERFAAIERRLGVVEAAIEDSPLEDDDAGLADSHGRCDAEIARLTDRNEAMKADVGRLSAELEALRADARLQIANARAEERVRIARWIEHAPDCELRNDPGAKRRMANAIRGLEP